MTAADARTRMPDLRRAIDAVAAAMPLVRLMGATLRDVPPVEKGDGSPVTAADFVAQAIVVDALRRTSPGGRVPLVGEESAAGLASAKQPDVERIVVDAVRATLGWRDRAAAIAAVDGDEPRAGEPFWTVDPIDGTKGFLLGEQCSVCLALIEAAHATVGAIGCPRMGPGGDLAVHLGGPGTIYAAASGLGAFELDGARRVLRRLVAAEWRATSLRWARSHNRSGVPAPSRLERRLAALAPVAETRLDSQCKYAFAARGDADLVLRMPRAAGVHESIWDHAPGAVIASEAGLSVLDAEGAPLDFSTGAQLRANRGIVCAAPGLAPAVIDVIRASRREEESP
jgi:3'(2'), 5'-bisphosphate nucleotidase